MPELVDRVDDFQRRHAVIGMPLAVIYKYFDDQGPYLAAIITYYAFISIFPILLIASSVLGFVLQDNPEMQADLLQSALRQFPIVGTQLGQPGGLTGSTSAVIVGALASLYGVLGLGSAAQHALNVAWAVPRNSRYNPVVGRVRGFLSMTGAGVLVLLTTFVAGLLANLEAVDSRASEWITWAGTLVAIALTAVMLSLMMRYTTSRRPSFRSCLPGGVVIALSWHALQLGGGIYVRRVVNAANEMNSVFALVLGLLALLFLASMFSVIGMEVSVVLREKLYPRALLTPFTDRVVLTEADRRAYANLAKATRLKGFQRIETYWDEKPVSALEESEASETEAEPPTR